MALFIITVWDQIDGDIQKKVWVASQEEVDEVLAWFEDNPRYEVVIEDSPAMGHYTTY